MKDLMALIPFLNLYPTWAQYIVVFCIIVIIVLLCLRFERVGMGFERVGNILAPTQSRCLAEFNIMNTGDIPFTAHDFFITVSLDSDPPKSLHRALRETGEKLEPLTVNTGTSEVVTAYFDVSGAIYDVPEKIGEELDLYCNIVVEAVARDGLREDLVFEGNTLQTVVVEMEGDSIHRVRYAGASYRTSAIRFLGNHAGQRV